MIERAPAKINVCLFVGGTRDDGRHELVSVMQAVDLCDDLRLREQEPSGTSCSRDEVVCPGVEGPNIVSDAIAAFRAHTGWDGPPVRIEVTKRIPVAAGMAGGSADAAATLRLLARVDGTPQRPSIHDVAVGLGSDVPAQVVPGRYLAEGAGERVTALAPVWPGYAVLVLPSDEQLSTPAVYAEFDRLGLQRSAEDLTARREEVRAAAQQRTGLPGALVVNDLAPAARSLAPSIDAALDHVEAQGADRALVSGSGPTVLGLFTDRAAARTAAQALRRHHPRLVLTEPTHLA